MTDARTLASRLPALRLRIAGEAVDSSERGTVPLTRPATGGCRGAVTAATTADVDRAGRAAHKAFARGAVGTRQPQE